MTYPPAYPACGLTRDQQKAVLRKEVPDYNPKHHDGHWAAYVKSQDDAGAAEWIARHTQSGLDPANCQ